MNQIWKFPLAMGRNPQTLSVPAGTEFLTVQVDNKDGQLCLWGMVNPENPPEGRRIAIYGTGHDLDTPPGIYLGTAQQGPFVWHVFELLQGGNHARIYTREPARHYRKGQAVRGQHERNGGRTQ